MTPPENNSDQQMAGTINFLQERSRRRPGMKLGQSPETLIFYNRISQRVHSVEGRVLSRGEIRRLLDVISYRAS